MPFSLIGPMLARLGPRRSCIIALWRRSAHVRSDASGITSASTRNSHFVAGLSRIAQPLGTHAGKENASELIAFIISSLASAPCKPQLQRARLACPCQLFPCRHHSRHVLEHLTRMRPRQLDAGRLREANDRFPAGDGLSRRAE